MSEDVSFQNMDSWRGGAGKFQLTFKAIIIMHINRCVQNGSVEWHGGYWTDTGNNPVSHIYVPDSRDVYSNSIKMLRACLLGYFDDKMAEADKQLQEEFQKARDKFNTDYEESNQNKTGKKDVLAEWYSFKVTWHIKLFEQLILLSKRLNFFEEETSEEEM